MNQKVIAGRILPSKRYFQWHRRIKRQLQDFQQRFDNLQKKCLAKENGDECFILFCKRPMRNYIAIYDSIVNELVPHDEGRKCTTTADFDLQTVTIGDIFIIPYGLARSLITSKSFSVDNLIIVVASDTDEYKNAIVCFKESSNVTVSILKDLRENAGLILEQTMFRPMKSNAEEIYDILQRKRFTKYGDSKETMTYWEDYERLFNEIMGLFKRSRIAEEHKPNITDALPEVVDDKVSIELFGIDSSVKSCGYRYKTLQVFVDDPSNQKINNAIKYVLEKHRINDFEIVPSIATYKPFLGVGAKVIPRTYRHGSVGGFAKKNSSVCALISRHVAVNSKDDQVVLSDSKTSILSSLIPETVPKNYEEQVLDISAALIPPEDTDKCVTKFKSEDGDLRNGKESTYEDKNLDNRRVHLWGATTAPGLGIITMPKIRDRDHDNTFIMVENRVGSSKCLGKPGDSGAMVCADDVYRSDVECISMFIGEDNENPGKYATFRIDKGLEQLERQTKTPFELLKE